LVLFDTLKNEKLKKKILEEGIVIYERGSTR
ncbi:MAG TPA: nucleotidyltransferase domain-containing protein, partial [Elusimicrobia bacterium]|nr:nucleotidyltransferase domain-containing protein [Elusimicrobiota bacterium]